jgi:tetrahydromethanopterin S-methyltransferase subunit G
MHVMVRDGRTDGKLDGFEKRVDERFDGTDRQLGEVKERLDRMEDRMEKVDERLFSIGRRMVVATIGICSTMIAGFGAVAAAIVATL